MKRCRDLILLALCLWLPGAADCAGEGRSLPGPEFQELALAERAFARASVERGMHDAFLTFLAEEAVIFRPGPVAGREWFASRPAIEGRLSWEPVYVDVASSGDLGYTTGPWTFLPAGDAGEAGWGHYVSVWGKSGEEPWRVVLDIGISHTRSDSPAAEIEFAAPRRPRANRAAGGDDSGGNVALADADGALRQQAAGDAGSSVACRNFAADEIRLYRDRKIPIVGKPSACRALDECAEQFLPGETTAVVSRSGDLGYTYGTLRVHDAAEPDGPGAAGSFLRIWRRNDDGAWKLVLDLVAPGGPD